MNQEEPMIFTITEYVRGSSFFAVTKMKALDEFVYKH